MPTRQVAAPLASSLATPPTRQQRRLALILAGVVLTLSAVIVPLGPIQLQRNDAFIPAVDAIILMSNLITAVLLFSQARFIGSRAVLMLASGYLFSGLIIVPHGLTFPGAFSPSGLPGAGLQTTAWLFIAWHFGFPIAVVAYVLLKRRENGAPTAAGALPLSVIYRSVGIVVGLVAVLTWIATVRSDRLPSLFLAGGGFTHLAKYISAVDFVVTILALVLLWRQRRSVLDVWLTVAVVALAAEVAVTTLVVVGQFSVGFYANRLFSVAVSTIVLIVLLEEAIRLYSRMALAHGALQLERERKMANLDAVVGAIAHEVRQPLTAISLSAAAIRRFLNRERPNLDEVRTLLAGIVESSFRVNDVFGNIRSLLREVNSDVGSVDPNAVVLGVLHGLRGEMNDLGIIPAIAIAADVPAIAAHKGQLHEVVFNLVQNAIDALKTVPPERRHLRVRTEKQGPEVVISVEDSGPGIAPEQLDRIFNAFFTTKESGMGLGLAICRMIIERHQGRLSASSQAGDGARFEIRLPIAPAREDAPTLASAAE